MQTQIDNRGIGSLGVFLRLWLVLGAAYALVKLAVDIGFGGFVDLRAVALWELLLVPLGQAGVAYAIRRRARHSDGALP